LIEANTLTTTLRRHLLGVSVISHLYPLSVCIARSSDDSLVPTGRFPYDLLVTVLCFFVVESFNHVSLKAINQLAQSSSLNHDRSDFHLLYPYFYTGFSQK